MQRTPLLRKHYLLSTENVEKVERLAKTEQCSAAEVVRKAIEAYDADSSEEGLDELLDVVEDSIAEALESTRATNRKVSRLLKRLT